MIGELICTVCGAAPYDDQQPRLIAGPHATYLCRDCAASLIAGVIEGREQRTWGGVAFDVLSDVSAECTICDRPAAEVGSLFGCDTYRLCRRDAAKVADAFIRPSEPRPGTPGSTDA